MKKVWALLLSVLVLLTLCACGPDESDDSNLTEKPVIYLYPETETRVTV